MSVKIRDFDESIAFLGDYGLFQVIMIVLLSLSAIPCGYMGVIVVFVSDTPEHRCKLPTNATRSDLVEERASGWVGDSCSRYRVTGNGTEAATNGTERCVDGWEFNTEGYSSTVVSETLSSARKRQHRKFKTGDYDCNDYDPFTLEPRGYLYEPEFTEDIADYLCWDLVCENAWKVPFSTSMFFVGVLIGSFISGHISDRFGRKPVFFITLFLQTVTALIQATSVSWVMFCVLNCMRGLSQISNYVSSLVLGSEMLSQSARVSFTLLGHSLGFGLGYALLPLVAYFIRGWRMLLVASAIPSFLFIPSWWLIPESPRWLLQRGRLEEAERVVRKAARRNRVLAPEIIFSAEEHSELMQHKVEEEHTYTYVDLIRTPNMRNITVVGVFLWLSVAMVFYGLSLNTSNLHGNVYLNCFISAVIDIGAYVATWLLIKRVSRPTLLFSTLMFCGVLLLITPLVPEDMPVMLQVLALVGKMGVSGAYSFIYVIFTELIPTVVRNTGFGIVSTAARIGTIICPFVVYGGVYSKILPYIIFGAISILAAAVSMLLPDTRDDKLPDLISQAKALRSLSCGKDAASAKSAVNR